MLQEMAVQTSIPKAFQTLNPKLSLCLGSEILI
jgi:hypothetical protein